MGKAYRKEEREIRDMEISLNDLISAVHTELACTKEIDKIIAVANIVMPNNNFRLVDGKIIGTDEGFC